MLDPVSLIGSNSLWLGAVTPRYLTGGTHVATRSQKSVKVCSPGGLSRRLHGLCENRLELTSSPVVMKPFDSGGTGGCSDCSCIYPASQTTAATNGFTTCYLLF